MIRSHPLPLPFLAALALGCGAKDAPAQPPPTGASSVAAVAPAAPAEPPPLDEEGPAIDLLQNRLRFHLGRGGLFLPVAGHGLWKYSNEYTSPWGGLSDGDGHPGRTLAKRAATLRFSWTPALAAGSSDGARVIVRIHAGAGQRLSINLNGRPVKNTTLAPGWQVVEGNVPAKLLHPGENRLLLSIARPGARVHSVEIVPISEPPASAAPYSPVAADASVTVAGVAKMALTGWRTQRIPIEIPANGWLRVHTGAIEGAARFRVSVKPIGADAIVLLDESQPAGAWKTRHLDLASVAGRLVDLELAVPEGDPASAAWGEPRILLAKAPRRERPAPVENVVLFVVDALRADRLALYNETRVKTPRITLAGRAGGVVFKRALAASPSSPPSHASIQTGQMPRTHGVGGDAAKPNPGIPTLSAILGGAGVATGFYGNNPFAMDRLRAASKWTSFHTPSRENQGGDCAAVVKGMLAFAAEQVKAKRRFFLSGLPFDPHTPYNYHPGTTEHYFAGPFDPAIGKFPDGAVLDKIAGGGIAMSDARWAQLVGLYDGEVEHLDACFGQLIDGLAALGVDEKTAIVLTSDHGEGFYEHHKVGHAYGHWFEVTDIPLVVLAPGLAPKALTVDTLASHIDIAPTILDLMGLPPDPRIQGQSLLPIALRDGKWTGRAVTSEYGRSFGMRSASYRYIVDYNGQEQLFDLASDPKELTSLVEKTPEALGYFRDLTGFYLAFRTPWRSATWGTLDDHGPGLLRHLGLPDPPPPATTKAVR
ncbi:MAG: hypothetical protein EXR72_05810 [Myxococcales bacterium]|nr:hypothetical protein [Myxococcales bacterium]